MVDSFVYISTGAKRYWGISKWNTYVFGISVSKENGN